VRLAAILAASAPDDAALGLLGAGPIENDQTALAASRSRRMSDIGRPSRMGSPVMSRCGCVGVCVISGGQAEIGRTVIRGRTWVASV
jgi:hypothetical protein